MSILRAYCLAKEEEANVDTGITAESTKEETNCSHRDVKTRSNDNRPCRANDPSQNKRLLPSVIISIKRHNNVSQQCTKISTATDQVYRKGIVTEIVAARGQGMEVIISREKALPEGLIQTADVLRACWFFQQQPMGSAVEGRTSEQESSAQQNDARHKP